MSCLPEMPDHVLQHMMHFLSTVKDLNNCDTTCKVLHNIVSDDQTWRYCISSHPHFPGATCRQSACIMSFLQQIKIHQCDTANYFLEVLGPDRWKALVERVMTRFFPSDLTVGHKYKLRGDTMGVLVELVQASLIDQLKCANDICCAEKSATFPTLRVQHLILQDANRGLVSTEERVVRAYIQVVDELLSEKEKHKIVRKSAFSAGVVLMENNVYDHALASSIKLIVNLMKPACIKLIDAYDTMTGLPLVDNADRPKKTFQKQPLRSGQTIDAVAPFSFGTKKFPSGLILHGVHTPVPKQIEDAAKELSLTTRKIIGDVWLVFKGESKEQALTEAYDAYTSDEDSFSSNDLPFEESDDDFSVETDNSDDDEEEPSENLKDFHERLERYGPTWVARNTENSILYGHLDPLIGAASAGNLNLVRYLSEVEGIDVNLRNSPGISRGTGTALEYARQGGHDDVVAYLISRGATDE